MGSSQLTASPSASSGLILKAESSVRAPRVFTVAGISHFPYLSSNFPHEKCISYGKTRTFSQLLEFNLIRNIIVLERLR